VKVEYIVHFTGKQMLVSRLEILSTVQNSVSGRSFIYKVSTYTHIVK